MDFISRSRVFNEESLQKMAERYAGTPDIHISVSHDSLLLHVWQNADETDDDTPNPSGPLAFIVTQKLLPSIPQNIDTQAEIYAEPSVEARNTIGQYVTLSTDLGIAQ